MNAPTPNCATVTNFMERVTSWSGPSGAGWVNLHWTRKGKDGKPYWLGAPYKTAQELVDRAQKLTARPDKADDIYFCLSLQAASARHAQGFPIAVRSTKNATLIKSVWADVDVKPPPKGYLNIDEALTAIDQFVKAAILPYPSAYVFSGGGIHIYWISDRPLTVDEWRSYAEGLRHEMQRLGLRADYGCTTDEARILRVPGTFNCKIVGRRRPVVLKGLGCDYDFAKDLAVLLPIGPERVTGPATKKSPDFDLSAFAGKKPAAAFSALHAETDKLSDGINQFNDLPLDPTLVFKKCPHYRGAMLTGGRHHGQGLWMLTVLGSTWFENGRMFAHAMSDKYPSYDKDETDAMFDRKLAERANGLGWPSCKAFENMGCELCAACAHKGKIKSPLHLAWPIARQAPDSVISQVKEGNTLPVEAIVTLYKQGADRNTLFAALNETYAVVRYGSQIVIACINGRDLLSMEPEDFHKMFGNVRFTEGKRSVEVSRLWFQWEDRRRYLGRGLVFEPGGPLDIKHDMLNLWRGFGIAPELGDWSLLRNHILNVVCSGNRGHYDYLIKWMAYGVQYPNEPIGVAVAFRGAQGAGKGIVARTYGSLFGKHFAHIANGDQLTGRFNASLATSCVVFLDEALWAGDKKGEGVLKALITEPRLQLEAKFRDPIMVDNRLRILVASNEDWIVPAGIGDRRWFILDIANTYAGTDHRNYWIAIYSEVKNGGAAAMFHDLLAMNLSDFDVRAVPHTAAKAQQQAHSLKGTDAWLYHVLQEGRIGSEAWEQTGLAIGTDHAYSCYEEYSKRQREHKPNKKSDWSKKIRKALGSCLGQTRTGAGKERERKFILEPLSDCRRRFSTHMDAPTIEWEPENRAEDVTEADQTTQGLDLKRELAREPDDVEGHPAIRPTDASGPSGVVSSTMVQADADLDRVRNMT